MKRVILDEADLAQMSPFFQGKIGAFCAYLFLRISGVNRLNKIYTELCDAQGCDFTHAWLKRLNISYTVNNKEVLTQLPSGAFITISNHPFGGLDGIMLVDLFAKERPDYKFMVNSILLHVGTMANHFVGVKPATPKSGASVENTGGLKQTLLHLKNGGAMGFFPAGAVSGYYHNRFTITDKEWQLTVIRLIQAAKVPVVPIYIHGKNSRFFNFLGRVHWQLRSVRMPYEILNKSGRDLKITIGDIIPWEDQKRFHDASELSDYLKSKTFELGK